MIAATPDTLMRMAAFEHVRRLSEIHDHLTAIQLKPGLMFRGERIPLINPQRTGRTGIKIKCFSYRSV
jgi:putative restriction endonuclease